MGVELDGLLAAQNAREKMHHVALMMLVEEGLKVIASNDPSRLSADDRSNLSTRRVAQMYSLRNRAIYQLIAAAAVLGWPTGFRQCHVKHDADAVEECWPVAYVDLPDGGQVSWHLPPYSSEWDGHDNDEKYRRIERYLMGS